MKDSPGGWSKLLSSVCLKYRFAQLKSDECVFIKIVPSTKSSKSANTFSAVLDTLPNVPERDQSYLQGLPARKLHYHSLQLRR
jgi:hypothetical protein